MHFIPVTPRAVEDMRKLAKQSRKADQERAFAHHLDSVAQEHGFHHWKHVTLCLAKSKYLHQVSQTPKPTDPLLMDLEELERRYFHLLEDWLVNIYDRQPVEMRRRYLLDAFRETPEGIERYKNVVRLSASVTSRFQDAQRL